MRQPTKREQLAAMRLEEFKEHLRTIVGGSSEQISGVPGPNPLLVRNRRRQREARRKEGVACASG
jgi:hypothetical protein